MNEFLVILIIIFGVFLLSFVLINIRHILIGKEFRGTCATNNPMIKNNLGECSLCGKLPGEDCQKDEMPNKASVQFSLFFEPVKSYFLSRSLSPTTKKVNINITPPVIYKINIYYVCFYINKAMSWNDAQRGIRIIIKRQYI